jgi:hypothetical protein
LQFKFVWLDTSLPDEHNFSLSESYHLHNIATDDVPNNASFGIDRHLDTSNTPGFNLSVSEKSGLENEENENFLQEFLTEGSHNTDDHTDHSKDIGNHENDSDDDDESSVEEEIITTHTLHPHSVMVNHNNYHNHQFAAINHNMVNVAMTPGTFI